MGTRKHNKFLDTGPSDDEICSQGYDSEAEDMRKWGRSPKRRKLESDRSNDEDVVSDQEEKKVNAQATADGDAAPDSAERKSKSHKYLEAAELPGISKPRTKKNLVATAAAIKHSGVVYLS